MKRNYEKDKDARIASDLNILRECWDVKAYSAKQIISELKINKSYLTAFVNAGLIVKHRVHKRWEYTVRKDFVLEQDVTNALKPIRDAVQANNKKRPKKVDEYTVAVVETNPFYGYTVENAIAFLKTKGYKLTIEI